MIPKRGWNETPKRIIMRLIGEFLAICLIARLIDRRLISDQSILNNSVTIDKL